MVNLRIKSLEVLRHLPRVALNNLKDVPHSSWRKAKRILGSRREVNWPQKGQKQRQQYARLGFAGGSNRFYLEVPKEPYNEGHQLRRHYPPLSLGTLQLMIDTGRIDVSKPIDLGTICNTCLFNCEPKDRHFGVHLTAEGIDKFRAKLNIEVQYAKEPVIAAIERLGGVITTAFYNILCVEAKVDAEKFLKRGLPIPRRELPPEDAFEYYSDAKNRGYLADPKIIAEERLKLSQKYGYELPDISKDPDFAMLTYRKDPRQVFDGLRPGWLVNLRDKIVLRPTDPEYIKYYES
ncbi:39S ribosomal protein L15, mitochondrial [Galendromus occidentalis]|uniref:Large ribosomal subunit protein uL15m n=1 Tax=Galendromus occidentalis TaxID=34638 RepID=A0AAJ6VXD1_9ACAR|nr:39S ribosomal protein L15, mitochondrial [Galendromus occidentalis]